MALYTQIQKEIYMITHSLSSAGAGWKPISANVCGPFLGGLPPADDGVGGVGVTGADGGAGAGAGVGAGAAAGACTGVEGAGAE